MSAKYCLLLLAVTTTSIRAENADAFKPTLDPARVAIGKKVFHDENLSEPKGQSCATCHSPEHAYADPAGAVISPGAAAKFGNRNAPSVIYSMYAPPFGFIEYNQKWAGGQFWDGRVDTLQEQAEGPFFHPLEMNNSREGLAQKLSQSEYKQALSAAYGNEIWQDDNRVIAAAADALAQFQSSDVLAPRLTSKFDAWRDEKVEITEQERRGMFVFQDKGMCLNCHPVFGSDGPILFTDFTYHNIGVPRNPASPFLAMDKNINPAGTDFIDEGMVLNPRVPKEKIDTLRGKFRTPSLRNVALTAPYMHNGVFKTLREVVEFYNTRDVSDRWGPPEVADNMDTRDVGNLKLSEEDIDALVAFMKILTDGYEVPANVAQSETNEPSKVTPTATVPAKFLQRALRN